MREIKFRAWQEEPSLHRKTGMYNVESIYFYPEHGGGEVFLSEGGEEAKSSDFLEDVVLMQKVDNEMWEGDVVEGLIMMGTAGMPFGEKPLRFEVVWDGHAFKLKEDGRARYFDISYIHDKKILGNIYENPDLLKDYPHKNIEK